MESSSRLRSMGAGSGWVLAMVWLMAWPLMAEEPSLAAEEPSRMAEEPSRMAEEPLWQVLDERPGTGEQCLVCRQAVTGADIVELQYQGRTFHIKKAMLPEFESDPERYFRDLQARSALFDEPAILLKSMASGWLIFGLYVLVGLLFGALCGYVAVAKALAPVPWFFAGLAGNAVALAVLWFTPAGDSSALPGGIPRGLTKVPTTRTPARCEACGRLNHPSAALCSGCRAKLVPTSVAETQAL